MTIVQNLKKMDSIVTNNLFQGIRGKYFNKKLQKVCRLPIFFATEYKMSTYWIFKIHQCQREKKK